jgi:tetratricopeptide (TPR) repeat protein
MNFLRNLFGNKQSELQQQILQVRRDNPQLTAKMSDEDIVVLLQQADQTLAHGEPMVFHTTRTNNERTVNEHTGSGIKIDSDHASIDNYIRLALTYEGQGRYNEAIAILNKCLEISSQTGYQAGEMASCCNLGIAYDELNNYPLAIEMYQKGLEIVERIGDKKGIASIHSNLANVYKKMGKFELAQNHYSQALKISEQSGDEYNQAIDNFNLGQLYRETGKIYLARTHLRKAQELFELVGDREKAQFVSRVLQSM